MPAAPTAIGTGTARGSDRLLAGLGKDLVDHCCHLIGLRLEVGLGELDGRHLDGEPALPGPGEEVPDALVRLLVGDREGGVGTV